MPISSRAARKAALGMSMGLGLAGVAGLLNPANAQAQGSAPGQDEAVRKPAATAKAGTPAVIGTIDLDQVLRGYDKARAMDEKLKAEVLAEQGKLSKLMEEGRGLAEQLQRLKPGTPDFQKLSDQLGEIKAKLEAGKESAQAKMEQRVAESMTKILEDIKKISAQVAYKYHMTYIVRISKAPVDGMDQRSVGMAMAEPVVYSDPSSDVSEEVVRYLNFYYKSTGGVAPSPVNTSGTAPKADAATAPASTTAPAPTTASGSPSTRTK